MGNQVLWWGNNIEEVINVIGDNNVLYDVDNQQLKVLCHGEYIAARLGSRIIMEDGEIVIE